MWPKNAWHIATFSREVQGNLSPRKCFGVSGIYVRMTNQ
jgi:hypothetical protein